MERLTWVLGLILVCAGRAPADDAPLRQTALALQQSFQDAIAEAQPSVACILVSRSDVYERWFGYKIPADNPGKLGAFDPAQDRITAENDPQLNEMRIALAKKYQLFLRRPDARRAVDRELAKSFDLSDHNNVPQVYGSGVVIGQQGLVLTNYHVVRDATKVYVRLFGGKGSYADIYAADPRSDLAVLRLLDTGLSPRPIKRGDGAKLRKGQLVLSLANPYAAGYKDGSPSASWGIISNLRRRVPGDSSWERDRSKWTLHQYGTMIQIDARLNLGCSGGALVDLDGRLIGLTTALAAISGSETAGGYAFPLDDSLWRIVDVLARGEEVEYGFLGVGFPYELPSGGKDMSIQVVQGSPADRAGLHTGETIVAINHTEVREKDDLFLIVGAQLAGARVTVDVRSPNGKRTLTAQLDKFYMPGKSIVTNRPAPVRGLRVDYTSVLAQREPVARIVPPGVLVREVQPGSTAEAASLQDAIITEVNGESVNNPAEFYRAAAKAAGPLELTVREGVESFKTRTVKLN